MRHHDAATSHAAWALQDISICIAAGEQIALIGPSGAGKTTLLHTLACAHPPAAGEFLWRNIAPWQMSVAARHQLRAQLFLAPQTPPLPPRQRVVTAVLAGCLPRWSLWQALASLLYPRQAAQAYAALARFNLQDKLYARVDRLSGGERQRCGLARLLLSEAALLLVDEPLSALDPALSLQTLAVLQDEARKRNASLICSLHQVEVALAHFPRLIGLRDGRIVFDAARADVTPTMLDTLYRGAATPSNVDTSEAVC